MEELLKQYKLASTGDLPAIRYLIENMGEGKILKTNNYALLQWYIKLGCEKDNDAYEKLFSPSNIEDNNNCSYIKPQYIKMEESLIIKNELKEKSSQVISDIEEWKKEKAAEEERRIAEEEARLKEEERKRIEKEKKKLEKEEKRKAEEEAKLKAEEEARRKAEEDARRKAEEDARRKAEEDARRKAEKERRLREEEEKRKLREEKIVKRQESWKSIIDAYLNSLDTFQYEEGILFMKKRFTVHYLSKPITWRIWNAFIHKDSLEDWEDREAKVMSAQKNGKKNPDDIMVQSKLGTFLKRINEYMAGKMEFDYLYNNKKLEEKILKAKLLKNGVYLYVKEK